ncbi:Homeobox protein DBX2 [Chelonia mydas]|uniref:Homeobox protein DBX2 n=1 Tax=Chelonia mydas TaxID=8469 RepID=M7BIN9_CHEMY|nr:Homeobox protein DBX2 [Chelonia mydas]
MFQKQKYISKTDRKKLAINLGLKETQGPETPHDSQVPYSLEGLERFHPLKESLSGSK